MWYCFNVFLGDRWIRISKNAVFVQAALAMTVRTAFSLVRNCANPHRYRNFPAHPKTLVIDENGHSNQIWYGDFF